MKKITFYSLSIFFLVLGITSCAKSTKGKVSNEWKIVSYQRTSSNSNVGLSSSQLVTNMTETTYTTDNTSVVNGSTVSSHSEGKVNEHTLTLKKDGTWTWIQDAGYTNGSNGSRTVVEKTGSWSFVGKTKGDEFKKHERILFNVLTVKTTSTQLSNQTVVSEFSTNESYLTGQEVMIYTIAESKNKEMELELSEHVTAALTNGVNTYDEEVHIVLKQK